MKEPPIRLVFRAVTALVAGLALAPFASATNLLVNQSFETWSGGIPNPVPQPDRMFNDGSMVVPGWNFAIGLSSDIYRDKNASGALSNYYDAAHLNFMAGSGSFGSTHEGVSQTFNVVPSTWHRVTFQMAPGGINYAGNWIEHANIASSWQVDITGAVASSVSQNFATNLAHFGVAAATNPLQWTSQKLFFKSNAVGGPVTLKFTAYGDMTHVFLDDVVVEEYPAPIGDDCGSATNISGPGPHPFDNSVCSTGSQGQSESLCLASGQTGIENDQWFIWTSSTNGSAMLTTCFGIASGSSDDTKVAIYDGTTCPTTPAIACNDDTQCGSSGLVSMVTWSTQCGRKYLIQLGRSPGALPSFGTFTITEFGSICIGSVSCPNTVTTMACPCGNIGIAGHGCANSIDVSGAGLVATGEARVSADTFTLAGSGMPDSFVLYFQGTSTLSAGAGIAFGDGLLCVGGTIARLGVVLNSSGASQFPPIGSAPVSVAGQIPQSGGVREYQAWYRDSPPFCTASTFNLTNALEVLWLP